MVQKDSCVGISMIKAYVMSENTSWDQTAAILKQRDPAAANEVLEEIMEEFDYDRVEQVVHVLMSIGTQAAAQIIGQLEKVKASWSIWIRSLPLPCCWGS